MWVIIIAWLALLPFLGWYGMFEGAKVISLFLIGLYLSLVWVFEIFKTPRPVSFKREDIYYFIWIVILTIASLFGVHLVESILGGSYRHQGVLFFITLWLVGWAIRAFSKGQKESLLKAVSIAVIVEAMLIILQKIFIPGMVINGRPIGSLGEPNAAAGFLAIGSTFLVADNQLFLPLIFLAIWLTGSRAGMIAFMFVIGGWVFLYLKGRLRYLAITMIIVFLAVFLYKNLGVRNDSKFENRPLLWQMAYSAFLAKPWLGYGAESGENVYEMMFKRFEMPLSNLAIDRSHNLFLDILIWSGALGLSAFTLWFGSIIRRLVLAKRKTALIGVFAFLVLAMFQPLGVTHFVYLYLIFNSMSS